MFSVLVNGLCRTLVAIQYDLRSYTPRTTSYTTTCSTNSKVHQTQWESSLLGGDALPLPLLDTGSGSRSDVGSVVEVVAPAISLVDDVRVDSGAAGNFHVT